MAAQYGVPLLGSLPLDIDIRIQADGGTPTVAAAPDSNVAKSYREIAMEYAFLFDQLGIAVTPLDYAASAQRDGFEVHDAH